jgi:hypothetical protein
MAKLGINTGTSPNDGTGDSLLQGASKINSNFNEIYSAIGNGTTITNTIAYAGIATYAGYAGIATYATSAGISTYSDYAGISTSTIGGIISTTQLTVSGISTFATGPVLIGSASSTGTTLQPLQVTGGAYISSSVGIGTTNPLSKFEVCDGDIKVGVNTSRGLILTSQNGTKYRILVNNDGSLASVIV